ncbi:MAG: hypothetical protein IPJ65_16770 [Archangiaceae bacterium]|nr:hypothetical protein [Archangiaceae bacterium]
MRTSFAAALTFVLVACGGGGNTSDGGTAGGSAGGRAGGSGGSAGGATAGGTGGSAGGATAGGTGGSAGGATAGGTGGGAGGATAGGTGGAGGMPMPGGETCATAAVLAGPGVITATTTGATNDQYFSDITGCAGQDPDTAGAPDVVFRITVPAGNRLTATVNATWDSVVNLVAAPATNCGVLGADGGTSGETCVGNADSNSSGNEVATYLNIGATDQDVFIVVDGFDATEQGAFSLTTAVAPVPAGDTCATAAAFTTSQTLTAQSLTGFAHDYVAGIGCATGSTGIDRVYKMTVPAGQRLTAAVTQDTGASFNPLVNLVVGTCTATLTCVAGSNLSSTTTDTAIYDNDGAAAVDVFVVVDTATPASPTGTFGLNLTLGARGGAGETCGNPSAAITSTQTLTAQSFTGFANNYQSNGQTTCRYGNGPDRAYLVQVPVGNLLRAVATGSGADGGPDLALSVASAAVECGTGPCLSGADTTAASESVTFSNLVGDGGTQTVRVIVDSKAAAPTDFSIAFTIAPPPANDSCLNVTGTPISTNTTLPTETLNGFTNDYAASTSTPPGCRIASGPDHAYAINIPAMQRVTITAQASGSGDLALSVSDAPASNCGVKCAQGADNQGAGTAETLFLDNTTASVRSVFLVVDRLGAPAAGETFSLNVTFAAIPPAMAGDICSSATVIAASGMLTAQTTTGFNDDYYAGSTCGTSSALAGTPGYDRVYSISVPAGMMLTATVDPTAGTLEDADPAIFLIGGPASNCVGEPTTQCLAGSDQGFEGDAETVTYTNSTGAAQTVFLVVDTWYASSALAGFTVNIQIQ